MESPLKGKILIASPKLQDPNFARSLVLIVQHDQNGAMGLVINRASSTSVRDAWTQVSAVPYPNDDPLFQGGPCEGPLIVLHKDSSRGQLEIAHGIFLSSDADAVKALVDDAIEPMKFFVGYAGWSPLQLETELSEGAWALAEIEGALILATPEEMWETLQTKIKRLTKRGNLIPNIDPRLVPPDPSVN